VRILVSSTAGAGHFGPLAPFVRSFLTGGHDVLVAGPPSLAPSAAATGAGFVAFDDPPAAEMAAAYGRLPSMSHDEANAWIVAEVFARLDATAAVPGLLLAIAEWRPDVVVRETGEFGAAVAAEVRGVPHARVAIGLGSMETLMTDVAAANVDALRQAHGLPADPAGARLHREPYLTLFPAGLEDPAEPGPAGALRFRDPSWRLAGEPARPFVYVTFGSVAGGMAMMADVYAAALAAVADLDADVLLTVGHGADPGALGAVPSHVRVEQWVDQAEVLSRASAVVCHGGGGSTLGAVAAGVPLVMVPLFAEDQHINARGVEAAGSGLLTRPEAGAIRLALDTVLAEPSFRLAARALAVELAGHPSTDEAAAALARTCAVPG
jgi:UDP:flavonoid glycosyltransferase YjiC (YdhE family)